LSERPPAPAIAVGDVVEHRSSVTGRGEVVDVRWVESKPKYGGSRWRVWVRFPQNRQSEVGGVGRVVVQGVDADRVRLVAQGRLF